MAEAQKKPWMQREWTPREGFLPTISIAQPFATAITYGTKCFELRSWGTSYSGPLLLHAGKQFYREREDGSWYAARLAKEVILRLKLPLPYEHKDAYPLGALVGIAALERCAHFTASSWETLRDQHCSNGIWDARDYGWKLIDVRRFASPVPFRGQLGLFPVEEALVAAQIAQAIAVPFTPVQRPESPEDRYRPADMVARYGPRINDPEDEEWDEYQKNEFDPPPGRWL